MAQRLRTVTDLPEDLGLVSQHPHGRSQLQDPTLTQTYIQENTNKIINEDI